MTVASASAPPACELRARRPGATHRHALPVGAAGFAWCSLALGLSTAGVMNRPAAP